MDAAMPCKKETRTGNRKLAAEVIASHKVPKIFVVVQWNPTNPRGNEWNLLYLRNHEDHIAGKGFTSMTHYNLVHKFIPVPQAMTI